MCCAERMVAADEDIDYDDVSYGDDVDDSRQPEAAVL